MELLRNLAYYAAAAFVIFMAIYFLAKVTTGGEYKKEL